VNYAIRVPRVRLIDGPTDLGIKTTEEARAALAGWPLGEPGILNAPRKVSAHLLKLADAMSSLTVGEAAELSKLLKSKWKIRNAQIPRPAPSSPARSKYPGRP